MEKVLSLLDYNKKEGNFYWKERVSSRAGKGSLAGTINHYGYRIITSKSKKYSVHRLVYFVETGKLPEHGTDHINHDRADNRFENLREANQLVNNRNSGRNTNNTSGVTGVTWCNTNKKWKAQISVHNKCKGLGTFDNFADAVVARKVGEKKYGFHENHGVPI